MSSTLAVEIVSLRAALCRALAPSLLLTLPLGCTSGDSNSTKRADGQHERDATKPDKQDERDQPTTAIAPVPPEFDGPELPSCPSGKWCGTKALAEPLRRTDEYAKDVADVGGCPGQIVGNDEPILTADGQPVIGTPYGDLPMHSGVLANLDVAATEAKHRAGEADVCCYDWMEQCPGGRPLLEHGRPQLARVRTGSRWTAALPGLSRDAIARLPAAVRRSIAQAWLADALMEHSSIASFARARAELEAVGAPAALLRGCERAALDERRHARLCFGLAAAYGAAPVEPEALGERPIRPGGLVQVAIDTFIEGCVGETVAAACVRRAAGEALDPALARILGTIADDETEHAALAWRTVAWAVERGGPAVVEALVAVAARLRPADAELERDAGDDELAPAGHGQLAAHTRAGLRREVWATIIDPLLASVVAEFTRGA
jgi:hypothetical protein